MLALEATESLSGVELKDASGEKSRVDDVEHVDSSKIGTRDLLMLFVMEAFVIFLKPPSQGCRFMSSVVKR